MTEEEKKTAIEQKRKNKNSNRKKLPLSLYLPSLFSTQSSLLTCSRATCRSAGGVLDQSMEAASGEEAPEEEEEEEEPLPPTPHAARHSAEVEHATAPLLSTSENARTAPGSGEESKARASPSAGAAAELEAAAAAAEAAEARKKKMKSEKSEKSENESVVVGFLKESWELLPPPRRGEQLSASAMADLA